jgi:hypothetical protein
MQHYWYTAWPDHNLPENPNALIQLIKQVESTRAGANIAQHETSINEMNQLDDTSSLEMSSLGSQGHGDNNNNSNNDQQIKGPVLVHCSAGVGRTGCFLAISLGIRQLDAESQVDIVRIVCQLRKERGGMIQTLEQYEFIYQVLAYYFVYYKKYPVSGTGVDRHHQSLLLRLSNASSAGSCGSPELSLHRMPISPNALSLQSNEEEDEEEDPASLSPLPAAVAAFSFNTTKMIQ